MEPDFIDMDTDAEVEEQEQSVPPEQFIAFVTQSQNLAADLSEGELTDIGRQVLDDYELDKGSMSDWFERMERGIKLAKLVKEEKTYPFKKAANIKYPLVTSAALQFNARAYPAIVPADAPVRAQTFGADPAGQKAARGERISAHMSWQLLSQMEEWEEETDNLLVQLPIVGTMVRKVWYDPVLGRPRCRLLDAGAFIVNDKVKNLSDAPRMSEELPLYPGEITTRIKSGQFIEFEYDEASDDKQASQMFIEQHCLLDLDEDGYAEPYIVTVHKDSAKVCRIVADFDESDVRYQRETRDVPVEVMGVDPMTGMQMPMMTTQPQEVVTGINAITRGSYFVAYKFMPSMDGGFHGTGLGLLLGDISDTINSIMNMLLDAGHMAALGGGFIGSDFRIKGGSHRFEPGEWKLANATGGTIRDSLVPLTFPGPDAVLFQMLGMLIDAGKEISSTQDIMTGQNNGKVQTATTTLALIDQGMMVFTASYKRIFRALKREYKLLAKINSTTVDAQEYNAFHDSEEQFDPAQDYGAADMDIQPTADPRSVTKMQEAAKAQLLMELQASGAVDPIEVSKRVLEAAEISDVEKLMPKPNPQAQEMEQFQTQMMMQMGSADIAQKMADVELTMMKIESERASTVKTMVEADAAQANLRLDAIKTMLEDRRNELERYLRLELGRMAGASRNGGPQGGNQGNVGPSAGGGGAGLLGGQGMAGIGAPGFGPTGGLA